MTAMTAAPATSATGATVAHSETGGSVAVPSAPGRPKLHGRAFYESIGSPKYIVAPMVDQSEFAWRMLTRSFLPPEQRSSILAYSPMLHARLYADREPYRKSHFEPVREEAEEDDGTGKEKDEKQKAPFLDGNPALDRPLFVQFCGNEAETVLAAARRVAPYCDAVDLNLGCPQGIARKGHYGAFLQEEPARIAEIVRTLHAHLDVPVTAKIRVLDTPEATLQYARTVLDAGASILTVHGRRREQKGHLTGLADWGVLRYLREHLPADTVLFANGNILQPRDLQRCLDATGFDGVMSAEGLLSDPGLFGPRPAGREADDDAAPAGGSASGSSYWWPTPDPSREYWISPHGRRRGGWRVDAVMRRYLDILHVYVLGAEAPPARRRLYVPGDEPLEALPEETKEQQANPARKAGEEDGNDGNDGSNVAPPSKKRKRDESRPAPALPAAAASSPNLVGVQAHLFHLLRHAVGRHHDIRDALARSRKGDLPCYERILAMLERRVAAALDAATDEQKDNNEKSERNDIDGDITVADQEAAEAHGEDSDHPLDDGNSSAAAVRRCRRPWWVAQPVLRAMPAEALAKGAIQLKKKNAKAKAKETSS